jgi:hypothetical protein
MPQTVHRRLKVTGIKAKGIRRQASEVRKQLQNLKTDVALFSETHLKSHMKSHIPNCDMYRTDCEDGHESGTVFAVKKGTPHICVDLLPLLLLEATRVGISIGNAEMFLAALHNFPQKLWSYADITELLGFGNTSMLAGDLKGKHPVWKHNFQTPQV